MEITEHTPTGIQKRIIGTAETRALAKLGDKNAINELISLAGGWGALTAAQKEKITQLLLGQDVTL